MKHLPKHLRPRWRYLVVGIETPADATVARRDIQAAIWEAGRALLGDPGSADAELRVVRSALGAGGGTVVVRVRRGEVTAGRAAIACVEAVGETPVGLHVRGVTGTLRAAEEKYMNGRPRPLSEERVVFDSAAHSMVPYPDGRVDIALGERMVGATDLDLD